MRMQTLWARVAQTRCSCNCSARFSSAAALTRRATTAPIRRRLALDDVLAAFFSTVAFVSAVADGNRKTAKLDESHRFIQDAKKELKALKADQRRRMTTLAQSAPAAPHAELSRSDGQTWEDVFGWGEGQIRERQALGFEDWRGLPLSVLRSASPKQIQDFTREFAHHFPKLKGSEGPEVWDTVTSPLHIKKIRTLEWSIADLALDLMSHTSEGQAWSLPNNGGIAEKVLSQLSVGDRKGIQPTRDYFETRLNELARRKEPDDYYRYFESPKLPRYKEGYVDDPHATNRLNVNIYSLFKAETDCTSPDTSQLLPNICYHLLTSDTPPSAHTYNLLFSGFAGARRDDLIPCLITSMYRTHMRPNEVTLAEILRYYVRTKDIGRFERYVKRMDGFGDGLGEACPRLNVPDLLQCRYRVRVNKGPNKYYQEYSDLGRTGILALKREARVRVYEKPRRNLDVHHSLIQGALSFYGTSEAIKHYRTMVSEGWKPDREVFLSILHHCVADINWEDGVAVWRRLQTLTTSIDQHGILLMVQLCQKCNKYEHIEELLWKGITQGVLPPTVLEMGWHERLSPNTTLLDPIKGLAMAKELRDLKRELQDLLRGPRIEHGNMKAAAGRIDGIVNTIERALQRPTLQTIALLHKARIHIAATHQDFSALDAIVRASNSQILSFLVELHDVLFSVFLKELEAHVMAKLCAIAGWLAESRAVTLSIRHSRLEVRFKQISTFTVKFLETAPVRLKSCDNAWIFPSRDFDVPVRHERGWWEPPAGLAVA
ncbi:MAG: hypothetical protein L6R40_005116 [Gallowayella cf. fulva]|nr:MAG: hypothetical protein L6R40_005116 [Xanthomendoza cf. fulva]